MYTVVFGGDPGESGIYLDGVHVVEVYELARLGLRDWRAADQGQLKNMHYQAERALRAREWGAKKGGRR